MTDKNPGMGFQGDLPPRGVYFDRVDEDGESHSRAYIHDGKAVIFMIATPDPDRPAKWTVGIRWHRREKWLTHGWGPLDSEADALQMMDAVGIGVEAISGGAMFLGHAAELVRDPAAAMDEGNGPRVDVASMLRANPTWGVGTMLTAAGWKVPKEIMTLDELDGVELRGGGQRYFTKTLPSGVHVAALVEG